MSNYLERKFPTITSLTPAIEWEAQAVQQDKGWQLPCVVTAVTPDGLFVTVNIQISKLGFMFENITIPVYQSQYLRNPIQVGDVGVTRAIDVSLFSITQQYGKIHEPNFDDGGNYSAILGFEPISSLGTFPKTADPNQLWMYGIQGHGVKISDNPNPTAANSTVTITNTGIVLKSGSATITISNSGAIDIEGSSVKIMGRDFLGHEHSGVQPGSGNSGGVV